MIRHSKNEEVTIIPWKRNRKGIPIFREPVTICFLCSRPVYGAVDLKKHIICGSCVQLLLTLDSSRRELIRDKLRLKLDE